MAARNQAETDEDESETNQENIQTRESEHLGNESENHRGKRGPAAVVGADAAFAAASVPAAAAPHAAVSEVRPVRAAKISRHGDLDHMEDIVSTLESQATWTARPPMFFSGKHGYVCLFRRFRVKLP